MFKTTMRFKEFEDIIWDYRNSWLDAGNGEVMPIDYNGSYEVQLRLLAKQLKIVLVD